MQFQLRKGCLFILQILLFLIGGFQSVASVQLYNNLPPNVRQSLAIAIIDNAGLNLDDIKVMAKATLIQGRNLSEAAAEDVVRKNDEKTLREIATKPFLIDYIEMPTSELREIAELTYQKSVKLKNEVSPLFFQREGVDYIRWFFHPLRDPRDFLSKIPKAQIKIGRFLAHLTESRSVIVMDRQSGDYWSIKLSLPKAAGPFRDKSYSSSKAIEQLQYSEVLTESDKNFLFEQEALGFLDEGISVRSIRHQYANGNFVITLAAVYTRGLKSFLNSNLSAEEIRILEKKWLAEVPGEVAADRHAQTGLIHNSNHSQNSKLVLSAEKIPIAFYLQDADFDVDMKHENAKKLLQRFPFRNRKENIDVDFSMSNGFEHPYYRGRPYLNLVFEFFDAFKIRYAKLNRVPEIQWPVSALVSQGGYYSYQLPIFSLGSQAANNEFAQYSQIVEKEYPELKRIKIDPFSALSAFLSRDHANPGGSFGVVSNYMNRFHSQEVNQGWNLLINEFLNLNTRRNSVVMKTIKSNSPYAFWNLCIMAGVLYNSDHELFIETLFAESLKYPGKTEALELLMDKLSTSSNPVKKETPPADHRRLRSALTQWTGHNAKKRDAVQCKRLL